MKKNNPITLSVAGIHAIEALQHKSGTYDYYTRALDRISDCILEWGDEMDLGEGEALGMLRTIKALKADLANISGRTAGDDTDKILSDAFPVRIDESADSDDGKPL